jgi:hypothetical protein
MILPFMIDEAIGVIHPVLGWGEVILRTIVLGVGCRTGGCQQARKKKGEFRLHL